MYGQVNVCCSRNGNGKSEHAKAKFENLRAVDVVLSHREVGALGSWYVQNERAGIDSEH